MKKTLLYSFAFAALALGSCTTWDEPVTENYGAGPSVSVTLAAATPTDAAFTIQLSPAEGTTYYAYVVSDSEIEDLQSRNLLQGYYDNDVLNTQENASYTATYDTGEPNTTYYVYAVASNDKGICGEVAVATITTADNGAPQLADGDAFASDPAAKAASVSFNQAVSRGQGAVTALYYKEWDWEHPVAIPADDISVEVSGNTALFSADVPAGSYVAFSWEAGAFVDALDKACAAYTSTFDEDEGDFVGAWVAVAKEPFAISEDYLTAPEAATFKDWQAFEGVVSFPFDIYVNEEELQTGNLSITYASELRTVTYNLTTDLWSVNEKELTFKLPAEPQANDVVTLAVAEGVIYDVYGNGNSAFKAETKGWKYVTFQPTAADVLGTFSYIAEIGGEKYDLGSFTISEYTGEDAEEGDVVITGLYLEDSEIYGYYDLDAAKLYIWRYQKVGTYEDEGETYGVLTYNAQDEDLIAFDITEDGIMSTDFVLVASDAAFENLIDYEVRADATYFIKAAANEVKSLRKLPRAKMNSKKGQKLSGKAGSFRKIRK